MPESFHRAGAHAGRSLSTANGTTPNCWSARPDIGRLSTAQTDRPDARAAPETASGGWTATPGAGCRSSGCGAAGTLPNHSGRGPVRAVPGEPRIPPHLHQSVHRRAQRPDRARADRDPRQPRGPSHRMRARWQPTALREGFRGFRWTAPPAATDASPRGSFTLRATHGPAHRLPPKTVRRTATRQAPTKPSK